MANVAARPKSFSIIGLAPDEIFMDFGLKQSRWQFWLFNLIIPVGFFALVYAWLPLDVFQFDPDEGIQLIKADLYAKGFDLYGELWNDQPPLFTVILSGWLAIFGKSVLAGRLLVLSFATLLVWAFTQSVRLTVGPFPAIASLLWLLISSYFLRLSASVMIGIPALALAMLSIYALLRYFNTMQAIWIPVSGGLLALSLEIKVFTVFLIPILLLYGLCYRPKSLSSSSLTSQKITVLLGWMGAFIAVLGITLFVLPFPDLEQTFQSHFSDQLQQVYDRQDSLDLLFKPFGLDYDFLLWGLLGIGAIIRSEQRFYNIPLLWLITALILLLNHQPIWYHHHLLLSIPLAWLGAYGIQFAYDFFQQENWRINWSSRWPQRTILGGLITIFAFLSIKLIPVKIAEIQTDMDGVIARSSGYFEALQQVIAQSDSTQWLFTDLPIYGFYADLNIPPELAVLSRKRLGSDNLTAEQLRQLLQQYQPHQVVLGRIQAVQEALNADLVQGYVKTYDNGKVRQYIRL